ncbi:hypothetical protein J4P02_16395 [Pseudomonas sp. NFXW11]|uniref:hypothetical protein n=1 Tax=Pseudomonas sp. NFXW11 TaxID=2819531 RepID=UPI003CF9781B
MELHYSITPAHTEARLAEKLPQAMLEHDRQQARIMAGVARWQKRLLGPLLFVLCLIGGTLALYVPERRFTPEKIIALVICGLIFIPLWWRYSGRWLNHLQALAAARQARRRAPLRELNQRLIAARLRAPLKAAEGAYSLSFDEQGFTLSNARGGKSNLAWTQVSQLQESADCYALASAEMARKGLACRIAKHSDLMPVETYQQGLQAFLSQCPVAPSAN